MTEYFKSDPALIAKCDYMLKTYREDVDGCRQYYNGKEMKWTRPDGLEITKSEMDGEYFSWEVITDYPFRKYYGAHNTLAEAIAAYEGKVVVKR